MNHPANTSPGGERNVEHLSWAHKTEAVEALAFAFQDYPVMRYVLKDAGSKYGEYLRALIGFFVDSRLMREWPLLGVRWEGRLAAVAAVNSPGKKPRPKELQDAYRRMTELIGPDATSRLEAFERATGGLVPDTLFHYLGMVGVRPEWRGRGLAGKLIHHLHALSEADPLSTGVCLSTEDAANVPLYRHLGYRVVGEADVGDIHTWTMFRRNEERK